MVDIETRLGVPYAAHAVLVPVRKHDDVATPRPVLVAVVNSDPAGAAGDDVEQDDAVGIWPEDLRCLPRGQRLVRPWLAVLGPKEYRSFQPQPLKRRLECRRRSALVARGHAIRCAGVAVMAKCRTPHKTDRVMNNHRPPRPGKDKRWPSLWTSTRWTARCQPSRSPELIVPTSTHRAGTASTTSSTGSTRSTAGSSAWSRLRTPTPRSPYTARRTASSPTRSFRSPRKLSWLRS